MNFRILEKKKSVGQELVMLSTESFRQFCI